MSYPAGCFLAKLFGITSIWVGYAHIPGDLSGKLDWTSEYKEVLKK
ncbi:hypothetical protein [Paenibacillus sp. OK076]|nr:hypothetical protein [Paenibacillus sp. OK076]